MTSYYHYYYYYTLALGLLLLAGLSEQQGNSTNERADCSGSFVTVGERCVHIDLTQLGTWTELRDMCQNLQGDLVILHDANFFDDLVHYINSQGWPALDFWVGGTDEGHDGVWLWVGDVPMKMGTPYWANYGSYNYQAPLTSSTNNCALMKADYHLYLLDAGCGESAYAICEQ